MVFLDDLKDLVLYKKPFVLPINEKNIKKGSAIYLISPNLSTSTKVMNAPYLVNKMSIYQSYYLEKNANYYINKEGFLQDVDDADEFLCEVGEDDVLLAPAKKLEDEEVQNMELYFLSDKYMDGVKLEPRVPDNELTRNGYEDNTTPRTPFCTTIEGCLASFGENVSGKQFYVYQPEEEELEVWEPNERACPDAKVTGEKWVLKQVQLKCVGKIKCLSTEENTTSVYTYGNQHSNSFNWNFKWIEKEGVPVQESVGPLEEKLFQDFNDYIKGKKKFENVKPLNSPKMHESKKKKCTYMLIAKYNSGTNDGDDSKDIISDLESNIKLGEDKVEFSLCYLPGDLFLCVVLTKTDKKSAIQEAGINLAEYKQIPLTQGNLDKYKRQYSNLNHVRINDNTKGIMYINDGKVVGMVNTEKKDGDVWIQGLEVFGDNKHKGIGYYLLQYAVKDLKATKLSVRKTNKNAVNMYKSYGFKTYQEDGYMLYMSIGRSVVMNVRYIDYRSKEADKYIESDKFLNNTYGSRSKRDQYNGEIAIDGDEVAGYVFVGDKVDKGFIHSLRVYPQYRGCGVGGKLLDDAIAKYGGYDLTVDKDNELAIDIYKRKGFAIDNSRNAGKKMYYMVLKSHKK